jgi:hypothetical protein
VERLLLQNLRAIQSFDRVLRLAPTVDRIAAGVLDAVLWERDARRRRRAIESFEQELVEHYAAVVQPAAREIGYRAAKRLLDALGPGTVDDEAWRARVLMEGRRRATTRLQVIRFEVNDRANTLENRLAAYWLQPGPGAKEKLAKLRALHDDMERRRLAYESKMKDFLEGVSDRRPAKPQIDYMSRMVSDTKQSFREQARREGTDAQTTLYVAEGHKRLSWVAVNAGDACPDCRQRQGMTGDMAYWDAQGRPGSGDTVCKTACFCMLVPAETLRVSPSLNQGLTVPAR